MNKEKFQELTGIDPTCQRVKADCLDTPEHEFQELFIDPSSGQLSMSRLCLGVMNLVGSVAGLYLAWIGQGTAAVGIIAGIAASDAGVYFGSTRKHYRESEGDQ